MLKINWTREGALGSYRELGELEGDVELKFTVLPEDMTTPQKLAGIFAKFLVKLPYSKAVQMTVGVEQTSDERYGGFKFRSIGVSDGMQTIANPLDFETTGKIFNALHNSIIDLEGNVHNVPLYNQAIEFADVSKENLAAFKANGRKMRQSLRQMRAGITTAPVVASEPAQTVVATETATDMAGAVQ